MRTENLSGNIIYKIMYCTSEVAICVSYVMSDHGLNCICPFLLLVLIISLSLEMDHLSIFTGILKIPRFNRFWKTALPDCGSDILFSA